MRGSGTEEQQSAPITVSISVNSPNLAVFSLHSGPNGLEMTAPPPNRGWINRAAAFPRQIGAQLGELSVGQDLDFQCRWSLLEHPLVLHWLQGFTRSKIFTPSASRYVRLQAFFYRNGSNGFPPSKLIWSPSTCRDLLSWFLRFEISLRVGQAEKLVPSSFP